MKTVYSVFSTQLGWCGLVKGVRGLRKITLPQRRKDIVMRGLLQAFPDAVCDTEQCVHERAALLGYFTGRTEPFTCTLDYSPASPFQKGVWETVRTIPYGAVCTYGWVARRMGKPGAARAVGTALGSNPFPLVIPCHRVIHADGTPGGFSAAQGTSLKMALLQIEGHAAGTLRHALKRGLGRD